MKLIRELLKLYLVAWMFGCGLLITDEVMTALTTPTPLKSLLIRVEELEMKASPPQSVTRFEIREAPRPSSVMPTGIPEILTPSSVQSRTR